MARTRKLRPLRVSTMYGLLALGSTACTGGEDLGECDAVAAEELVYSSAGLVATKGQALAHDSCGNGVFCHSEGAQGPARRGAPHGLNFDMLPTAHGLADMMEHAEVAWATVKDGEMPPSGTDSAVVGDGGWSVDPGRDPTAPRLPPLSTEPGKAAFRNWLACGAPVVAQTYLPQWVTQTGVATDEELSGFDALWDRVLQPRCATAGCHAPGARAGGLSMPDRCGTYEALFAAYACGEPLVRPGNSAGSFLIDKLGAEPRCGTRMPPSPQPGLSASERAALARWIDEGAGSSCP